MSDAERGLTSSEAAARLREHGPNTLRVHARLSRLAVMWHQLRNPLLLLLAAAAVVSLATGELADATIVLAIVLATVAIGYRREYRAQSAAAKLAERVRTRATVVRDGATTTIPVEDVVPGDLVLLAAGSLVPADARVVEAADCWASEAVLTGESFPVEKRAGELPPGTPLARRTDRVFLGTNIRSGTARAVVVATGRRTELGAIAHRLTQRRPETELDRGLRRFGSLLTIAMLLIVLVVFAAHVIAGRPPVETLLFAIALAVGLSPELLPAILSINLARGAEAMARRGVLVRFLDGIENLGSMDVLCTDKTGTLTEGVVAVEGAYDPAGARADEVLELAAINAALETGLPSPLDDAILAARTPALATVRKLAEIPFDFVRRRVSVVVRNPDDPGPAGGARLIAKGAFHGVIDECSQLPGGGPLDDDARAALIARHDAWSAAGVRVLAIATRRLPVQDAYARTDEHDLTFAGFVTFLDRPKADAREALAALAGLGVAVKIITGDSALVARHVAGLVGLPADRMVTGGELEALPPDALGHAVESAAIFAEVDPHQKERIIVALRRAGHVVGFLGDGVNDAPAMHAADTSLSVEHAVDVARAAADFVLLEQDLDVIRGGIEEGRRTFANTLKYILTTTSANLGNMISMAVASMFLPFLPLLAGQVLLNNFLSDIPAFGIAGDAVDRELVDRPRRWDIRFIGRFMLELGLVSSLFDVITFGVLLWGFDAAAPLFRTGWFVESLLTELVIALVVRTRRRWYESRPGSLLLWSTLAMVALTLALPYAPGVGVLGMVPLPPMLVVALIVITLAYVGAAEIAKKRVYGHAR